MTMTAPLAEKRAVPEAPAAVESGQAWHFCWHSLLQVSRTFSRPIECLPRELRAATTCGYLLCRVADTVEDYPNLAAPRRDALYRAFLATVEDGADATDFVDLAARLDGHNAELELCANLDLVLEVFSQLPDAMQQTCRQWVAEMVRGMSVYGHRPTGDDGLVVLETMADLERYCYFVAGTVGHLLTGLFCEAMDDLAPERAARMRRNAEGFGLGLQMVNILKDQTDDLARGWCFIPRTLWDEHGLSPQQMLEPANHERSHRVVQPVFARAQKHLDDALAYTLAIPAEHASIRLFCLLPLWMAARTLVHARGNDAMFSADEPVKISREEVATLIADASQAADDDAALHAQFDRLWDTSQVQS